MRARVRRTHRYTGFLPALIIAIVMAASYGWSWWVVGLVCLASFQLTVRT